jgi:hypothetical protein
MPERADAAEVYRGDIQDLKAAVDAPEQDDRNDA